MKYPLDEILLVAFATLLTGGETYVDMADFAEDELDLLREMRPFKHGAPSHDTFGRVLSALDAEQFGLWFARYVDNIATRYDKLDVTFLYFWYLRLIAVALRDGSVNTPW